MCAIVGLPATASPSALGERGLTGRRSGLVARPERLGDRRGTGPARPRGPRRSRRDDVGAGRLAESSSDSSRSQKMSRFSLVALHQLVVGEPPEPLGAPSRSWRVAGPVAGRRSRRGRSRCSGFCLQREVLVGPQVVDPELSRPRRLARRPCGRRTARWPSRPARRRCRSAGAAACGRRTRASSLRRTVSPAPPSNSTLSGTTIAARPSIFEQRLDVLHEVELLVRRRRPEVLAHVRSGLSRSISPSSLTMVIDDFLPNGGLVSTMSKRSPGSAASASSTVDRARRRGRRRCRAGSRFMAQSRAVLSTISQPVQRVVAQVPLLVRVQVWWCSAM